MHLRAAFFPCFFLLAALASARRAQADDNAQPDSSPPEEPLLASAELTVRGKVVLPDGSPAAGAIVRWYDYYSGEKRATVDERTGKFELQAACLGGLRLHATSADGRDQAVLLVADEAVRSYLSRPLTVVLRPAKPHQVVVTAQGRPVEDAQVSIAGKVFGYVPMQAGITGADGIVTMLFPEGETMIAVVAWHPRHGVNGVTEHNMVQGDAKTELALWPSEPHVARVLDRANRPVAGVALAASMSVRRFDWIEAGQIDATRATTDENGEVRWDWFPKGVKFVNVHLLDRDWQQDKTDKDQTPDGLTTLHVRRKFPVEGRLILPDGADAHGILITGHGFGPWLTGNNPRTRTRQDGSFTLDVPAGYGYVLGVHDLDWTSGQWSGDILPREGEPQREIVLHGERATPLDFLVTRGPLREPVENARVHVSRRGTFGWTDETGEKQNVSAGIGGFLWTDENGRALTGVGRGEIEINMTSGEWHETKTIKVNSDELIQIAFHREWIGNRVLTAQPKVDGKKHVLSSDALVLAWTERWFVSDSVYKPTFTDDGRIVVEFDQKDLLLLVVDRRQGLSGFVKTEGDGEVDLPMLPCATYSGTLVDSRDGAPLADRLVRLEVNSDSVDAVEPQRTDDMGQFKFDNIPASVQLFLTIPNERGRSEYSLSDERKFQPGERRTGDVVAARLMDPAGAIENLVVGTSIATRIADAAEKCRVTGMRAIVLFEGDDSRQVDILARRLTMREIDSVHRYLPVRVTAQQQRDDAVSLAALKWPRPAAGEVLMVMTADGKEASAFVRLSTADPDAAVQRGAKFIDHDAPPMRDGRKRLAEAKAEAANSHRTVWVIVGGTRCGPYLRLLRWIDRHHEVLEKDLVIVKLTHGLDTYANEIREQIGGGGQELPFHAMLSPAGETLLSSEGPLGNIFTLGSLEGARHFRTMLEAAKRNMTPAEIDELIDSLNEEPR